MTNVVNALIKYKKKIIHLYHCQKMIPTIITFFNYLQMYIIIKVLRNKRVE